jgi:hypothetical protein
MPLDFLNTTKSAQFYRMKHSELTNIAVERELATASRKRDGNAAARDIRIRYDSPDGAAYVSYICFKLRAEPPFLSGSTLEELRYAFLLLIEVAGTLAVFKRYAELSQGFLNSVAVPFGYESLGGVFVEGNAMIERLSLRGMGLNKLSIRRRSVEAADLGRSMPTFGINRSLPSSFRTRSAGSVNSVTPGTNRVVTRDQRCTVEELISWVAKTGVAIAGGARHYQTSFLANFCRPVPLKELPQQVQPKALLIHVGEIEDLLCSNGDDETVVTRTRGRKECRVVGKRRALRLLDRLRQILEITDNEIRYTVGDSSKLIGRLDRLSREYRLRCPSLSKIRISLPEADLSVEQWLNKRQQFTIGFSEPQYAYAEGQLFEDRRLLDSIPQLLEIIHTCTALALSSAEKGVSPAGFDDTSVFGVLEADIANDAELLVCTDLGDEWADYIEFSYAENLPRLAFYHCKHGPLTTSASKLQDVIGQATKNLARLHASKSEFLKQWDGLWSKAYPAEHPFPRLRRGRADSAETEIEKVVASARTQREVVLVLSFYSKKQLVDEFAALRDGQARPHIAQLLWFLSAFVGSCREHGVMPRIVCQP